MNIKYPSHISATYDQGNKTMSLSAPLKYHFSFFTCPLDTSQQLNFLTIKHMLLIMNACTYTHTHTHQHFCFTFCFTFSFCITIWT